MPAYNEATVIKTVIAGLKSAFSETTHKYQIIVVDDGSNDTTAQVARQAGAYVIRHILNTGTGSATATGLNYAQRNNFDLAATLDADGQHDANDVIKGIKLINSGDGDLLIGSRLIDKRGMSRAKVFGNKSLSLITGLLFGIRVTDSQTGLRIFSQKALEQLRWKASGFDFGSEMLWRAKQLRLSVKEYPIKAIYTDYSKSKGQNNWNAFNIIKSLFKRRVMEIFGE